MTKRLLPPPYVEIVIEFLKFNFDKNNKKIANNISQSLSL